MLTQSQLQSLKSNLKVQISHSEEYCAELKEITKELYKLADPEDKVNGQFYFDTLNAVRNDYRKEKQRLKSLVSIQKTIKTLLSFNEG